MFALGIVVVLVCFKHGLSQGFGGSCNQDGVPGVCVNLGGCPSVLAEPQRRWSVKVLSAVMFMAAGSYQRGVGQDHNLCMAQTTMSKYLGKVVAAINQDTTTTEYVPAIADYKELFPGAIGDSKCAPIPQKYTAEKTGRKAFDKCIEYQEKLVYPCVRGVDYTGKLSRGNYCLHNADELIVGGTDAKRDEFPHMALLGFGDGSTSGSTLCGGTVISENFILTAAHCTFAPKIGKVTTAKVGLLTLAEDLPASRIHRIKRVIKHPQYRAISKYHDIALLETETPIILDQKTIPACIDIGESVDDTRAAATGWGYNKTHGQVLDVLQKVTLQKFSSQECTAYFVGVRHLDRGFDEQTQICYGDHKEQKDTCQGDSGGPLQIKSNRIHCMYTAIGVTSFGKYCGQVGRPGVYTRVSHYARWIESVVWP